MTALRVLLARLRSLFGRRRRDAELRAEIDGHIQEATDDFLRQGMSPADARRAALRHFGGVTQTVEAHRELRRFLPLVDLHKLLTQLAECPLALAAVVLKLGHAEAQTLDALLAAG